jgi:hypothetical protein
VSRHYSAETLALYREDAVSSRKAARIRSHLAGCSTCSAVIADLVSVSLIVHSVQAPPMPDRLAERIQMALAGESAARLGSPAMTGAPAGAAPARPVQVPGRPDLPERSRQGRRRLRMPDLSSPLLLRTLAATGAVAIIAGGGYLLASGQAGSSSSAANGPSGALPAAPRHSTANRNASASQSASRTVQYRVDGKTVTATLLASHTDFTRKAMARQVRLRLTSFPKPLSGPANSPGFSSSSSSSPGIAGISMSRIEGCMTRIAAGRSILLADVARYLGRPATIIVFAPVKPGAVYDVAVVGVGCSSSVSDLITTARVPGT